MKTSLTCSIRRGGEKRGNIAQCTKVVKLHTTPEMRASTRWQGRNEGARRRDSPGAESLWERQKVPKCRKYFL